MISILFVVRPEVDFQSLFFGTSETIEVVSSHSNAEWSFSLTKEQTISWFLLFHLTAGGVVGNGGVGVFQESLTPVLFGMLELEQDVRQDR